MNQWAFEEIAADWRQQLFGRPGGDLCGPAQNQRLFRPYGDSYALMIAVSDYPASSGYSKLPNAVKIKNLTAA